MSFPDLIVVIIFILLVPKLVEKYLGRYGFIRELRIIIALGGMLWIVFSCVHGDFYWILGIWDSDAVKFEKWWYPMIVQYIESGNYEKLVKTLLSPGRFFYVTYQAVLYYYTGITVISILAINAFVAFWGGLTLTRLIYSSSLVHPPKKTALPLLLIFAPSVVFWSAANLKEALTYWSICQLLNLLMPARTRKEAITDLGFCLAGLCLGSLLRPHIIVIWFGGVLLIKMFQPHGWKYLVALILLCPVFLPQINKRFELAELVKHPTVFISNQIRKAEQKYEQLVMRGERYDHIRSTFTYGEGLPIPVLHGAISTLFRPFLWQIKNLRSMLSSLEMWTISLCIIVLWMRMTTLEWRTILFNPLVCVALLASIPFFFFFTYTPNEGWITRQRVQMFPVFMIMLATPLLLRRYYISIGKIRKRRSIAQSTTLIP